MEDCLNKGLARSIGISNFLIPHVEAILKVATVKPAVNQIELHPYLQRTELREYLDKQGITVQAYGPLTPFTKAGPGPVDAVAERLAKKYGVSTSSVLIRWLIEQGVAVVTTSGQKKRLQDYLEQVPGFKLSEDEVKEISKAGSEKNFRGFFTHRIEKDCFL
jgi:diketogulonate reductase-like aldo/keto reductase